MNIINQKNNQLVENTYKKNDVKNNTNKKECKYPDKCCMGYYAQINKYYCSKCEITGLKNY